MKICGRLRTRTYPERYACFRLYYTYILLGAGSTGMQEYWQPHASKKLGSSSGRPRRVAPQTIRRVITAQQQRIVSIKASRPEYCSTQQRGRYFSLTHCYSGCPQSCQRNKHTATRFDVGPYREVVRVLRVPLHDVPPCASILVRLTCRRLLVFTRLRF
jgi:hypothetical protein